MCCHSGVRTYFCLMPLENSTTNLFQFVSIKSRSLTVNGSLLLTMEPPPTQLPRSETWASQLTPCHNPNPVCWQFYKSACPALLKVINLFSFPLSSRLHFLLDNSSSSAYSPSVLAPLQPPFPGAMFGKLTSDRLYHSPA